MSTFARLSGYAAVFITTFLVSTQAIANDHEECDYNGKVMRCRRDWSSGTMKVTWEDGITDSYNLIDRTTTTSATWKDSRGGIWNSLIYSGSMILRNASNKNTIIFNGTRNECVKDWKLGNICGMN